MYKHVQIPSPTSKNGIQTCLPYLEFGYFLKRQLSPYLSKHVQTNPPLSRNGNNGLGCGKIDLGSSEFIAGLAHIYSRRLGRLLKALIRQGGRLIVLANWRGIAGQAGDLGQHSLALHPSRRNLP